VASKGFWGRQALGWWLLALVGPAGSGCASHTVPQSQSLPARIQVELAFASRIWVAGFVTDSRDDIDLNVEAVRLLRTDLRTWSRADIVDVEAVTVDGEARLRDTAYWRRLGQEYGSPLIVTGSIKLLLAPPAIVQRGKRTFYLPSAGRVLEATAVLVDGSTGQFLSESELPSRMRYGVGRFSGLSLFYQMMDQARSDWLTAIGNALPVRRARVPAEQ
jgi:hypothetical protein